MAMEDVRHEVMPSLMTRPDTENHYVLEAKPSRANRRCCLVIYQNSPVRQVWSIVMGAATAYTATVFPYHLAFHEFRVPVHAVDNIAWTVAQQFVNALFTCDLVLNFMFTYTDRRGCEVDDACKIAKKYIRTFFILDALACLPPELFSAISPGQGHFNEAVRLARIHRIARLARLFRLVRLAHLLRRARKNWIVAALEGFRAVRIFHFAVGLLLIVHILACGWYLCASLHGPEHYEETWLGRRTADADGTLLILASPGVQWIHAMYFILTVFTTVGFGDMFAVTTGEIVYVSAVMLVGAVVHSIIVSEMISIVTSLDESAADYSHKKGLIDAFAAHTQLDERTFQKMQKWLSLTTKSANKMYDRKEMQALLTGGGLPRELLGSLPGGMYNGRLMQSQFIGVCCEGGYRKSVPPRMPLLLALHLQPHYYRIGEEIYHSFDHAFNLFLVFNGTFTYVATPTPFGGVPEAPQQEDNMHQRLSEKSSMLATPGSSTIGGLISRATMKLGGCSREVESDAAGTIPGTLFPYQLFSHHCYFGDIELFANCPRLTTARCESSGGTLGVIPKKQLFSLADEFPQFKTVWKLQSRQRMWAREKKLRKLTDGQPVRSFAASCIQQWFRALRRLKGRSKWALRNDIHTEHHANGNAFLKRAESGIFGAVDAHKKFTHESDQLNVSSVTAADLHALRREMQTQYQQLHLAIVSLGQQLGVQGTCHGQDVLLGGDDNFMTSRM
mmetsp:Transcript_91522/g.254875  ORF Transcript_91522/g.254875 Transcript_91522/m.254875 type:complete len:730 (-) Transcript_91522:163-2352(-)|eukprot:CAMPEP_0179120730 /NCGR_PEP_ID=MMETSP0796-20121207/56898_1 /TAXON_ID=73915 /ORGANISM="Pyrodinium bahamense, Strain pbaha01" /LENGTH=729 /DNA_ID=CAMNT_0020819285 /DNA_START=83 /DNA_END=2272 /DNA_ORIENTATION=-